MAQFRIKLITPNNDRSFSINDLNTTETFLSSLITDYQDQNSEYLNNKDISSEVWDKHNQTYKWNHSVSYTYDEKLSLHKHAQKELTFNLDDKIFSNNEWIENPYARILRTGTQLELTDKYNNCMLFTINKVNYNFNNLNIIYNITCQDSFSYQLTRQNQGYVLQNDENESSFIGALDIDNWTHIIVKDCYLTYDYIPLNSGIYQTTDGVIVTFSGFDKDGKIILDGEEVNNVQKIIKMPYSSVDYPEYYETFPFSASGSSALSALIALGDQLGLQLNVVEGLKINNEEQPIQYVRYFFFGPTKNNEVSGLTYSPLRDIQNFSLNFSGDVLTTVLNVKSTTWNDEEIGLLPKMPDFFVSQILTDSHWTNSKYYPGFFLELMKGERYSDPAIFSHNNFQCIQEINSADPEERSWLALFEINLDILKYWPTCYNQIQFTWDGEHQTTISGNGETITPKGYEMGIATNNEHAAMINPFSLYGLWRSINPDPDPTQRDHEHWNYTEVFKISSDYSFNNLTQYNWDFTYNNQNYRCTILKNNDEYYLYLMTEQIKDVLYQHLSEDFDYDDFINNYLFTYQNYYIVPTQYQGEYSGSTIDLNGQYIFFPEYSDIPVKYINEFNEGPSVRQFYFYIRHTPFEGPESFPTIQKAYIRLGRKYTKEEYDFAQNAEACPWLENKLIDFSYFYKLGIISRAEYENLIDFITNDLRIINGQLMCYASSYYQSLHEQTELLVKLQAKIDKLGAVFYADVVEPFARSGSSKLNTGDFVNSYNELFNLTRETEAREGLLELNKIISNYFNKYFNAEQRFLKNIYHFRHFFESQNVYSINHDTDLQEVNYTIISHFPEQTENEKIHIGFNSSMTWKQIEESSSVVVKKEYEDSFVQYYTNTSVYQWQNGHYVTKHIPNINNYQNFYVPLISASVPYIIDQEITYNPKNTYFLSQDKFEDIFPTEDFSKIEQFEFQNKNYILLDYSHILKLFLYNHPNEYYLRDTNQKVPLEWVRCNCSTVQQACSIHLWNGLDTLTRYVSEKLPKELSQTHFNTFWSYYKALTPFESIFVHDFNLQHLTDETNANSYTWTVNDENNHNYQLIDGSWYQYDLIRKDYGDPETRTPIAKQDLYTAFYEVSQVNFKDSLSAIFGAENANSTNVLNILNLGNSLNSWKNSSTFYTHTYEYDYGKLWANIGVELASIAIGFFYPWGWEWKEPVFDGWTNADSTDYILRQYILANNTFTSHEQDNKNEPIPSDWTGDNYKLGQYNLKYSGDCTFVNYTKSITAEDELQALTKSYATNENMQALYPTVNSSSSWGCKLNWKHYDNYFSKIGLTYSTGSWLHDHNDLTEEDYTNIKHNSDIVSGNDITYTNMFNFYATTILNDDTLSNNYSKFWTRNRYARFCTMQDAINTNDEYIWVKALKNDVDLANLQDTDFYIYFNIPDTQDKKWTPKVTERFSAIKFYPLVEGKEKIKINSIFSPEELKNHVFTIRDLLLKINKNITLAFLNNEYIFKLPPTTESNTTAYYCLLHLEPYEKCIINNETTYYTNSKNYHCSYQDVNAVWGIYHNTYTISIDPPLQAHSDQELLPQELLIQPFYVNNKSTNDILVLGAEDTQLIQVSKLQQKIEQLNESRASNAQIQYHDPWLDDNTHWYEIDDLSSRVYTLKQSFDDSWHIKYYYLANEIYHTSELTTVKVKTKQNFSIFVTRYTVGENGAIILNNSTKNYTVQYSFNNSINQTSENIPLDDFNIQICRTVVKQYDIKNMSNGDFWYTFHNRIDIPNLLEKVCVIETELTSYWDQAYTASQYCQWFLPPTWLIEQTNNNNYFSGLLYTIKNDGSIALSTRILPEVEIYSYEGKTLLPAYIYHYIGDNSLTTGNTFIEDTLYLKHNPAILNAINHILSDEVSNYQNNIYNFTAQENGVTTYYYNNGGGLQYKNVLHTLSNAEAIYSRFDGLYVMQLKILLTQYVESASTLYETTLNNKLELWKHLYARFPGIFLENTYENKDARSSTQLLQMAQLAFKDYTAPETQYNITVIDAYALDGYQGQELHIGDGILLKSSDYYDAVDETYRALNQYLFISDINYNLRQDTDIALTVNAIKYQDKLLQSIVKLIR